MDLNTHRKHTKKNSTIVPQQCRATSQNFSEGERREKHLITSNPCEPFWSPKVSGCPRPCVCSVSGNDLPLHERCSVRQRGCLPRSSAAPFLVNSSFPGPALGARRSGAAGAGGPSPGSLLLGSRDSPNSEQLLKGGGCHRKAGYPLAFGESILKPTVIKHNTPKPGDGSGALWAKTGSSAGTAKRLRRRPERGQSSSG